MAPFAGQSIISYHRSWIYFTNRFGLAVAAELEPKPGIEPTPGHLSTVVEVAKQRNVKVILQEPFYSRGAANAVAQRSGAKVLVLPGSVGHTAAASDYFKLMDTIVDSVSAALR
jgi:ABC-type Zn uptake system ZnuABC Zn-binding protein ZnuA